MSTPQRVVREIPALYRGNMSKVTEKENVTYYARVSTDHDEQEESYERQRSHFEQLIKAHPEWNYVEGYADQGITGTKAELRPEFMRMINDCRAGKINKILVKSISRFARNTVDTLKYVRELKELGISVFFETQGIDTMTPNGEVLITILAAIAEQESRTISTNIKWSYKKRFQDGKVIISAGMIGYKKEGDSYVIVENEAKLVKRIFLEYISGKTIRQIADGLNADGFKTKRNTKWKPSGIQSILANEKYTGNAYLGKTFKQDVLSKTRVKNIGQGNMYYVENSHPAIISQETFDLVQKEREKRNEVRSSSKTGKGRYSSKYPLSGMLICGNCGSNFRRYGRNLANGEYVPTWICTKHQKNRKDCEMKPLKEVNILETYKMVIEENVGTIKSVVESLKNSIDEELATINNDNLIQIEEMLNIERKKIMNLFKAKKEKKITVEEYNQEYSALSQIVKKLEQEELYQKGKQLKTEIKNENIKEIKTLLDDDKVDITDAALMKKLLEYIKVINNHTIEFVFTCGITVTKTI